MALARGEGCEVIDLGIVPDRLDDDRRRRPPRPRRRRRYPGDLRRRLGRRLRPGAEGAGRRRARAVVLEGRAAARAADDARPARRHARARPARQSGLGLRLRGAVPGPADPPARRTRATSSREIESARARLRPARQRRARRLPARHADATDPTAPVATPFPQQDSSMLVPLAKADCLLVREPHAPGRAAPAAAAAILKLGAVAHFRVRSRQIKWLRNTYGTYSVCS